MSSKGNRLRRLLLSGEALRVTHLNHHAAANAIPTSMSAIVVLCRLTWSGSIGSFDENVVAQKALIRMLSTLLRPVFAWNDYWTTPRGEAGLRAYLAKRSQG